MSKDSGLIRFWKWLRSRIVFYKEPDITKPTQADNKGPKFGFIIFKW